MSTYIKIPIRIYDSEEERTTGKHLTDCRAINIRVRIDPSRIESYYPCIPGNEEFARENMTGVYVNMHSGTRYVARMPITEFEKLLNQSGDGNE